MLKRFCFLLTLICMGCNRDTAYNSWPQYKGSNENIHYSSLIQVDITNVKQLKIAWTYHTLDADTVIIPRYSVTPSLLTVPCLAQRRK